MNPGQFAGIWGTSRVFPKTEVKRLPFDAARYLNAAAIAEYMTAVLETGDDDLLLLALGDIARARGMAEVAKATEDLNGDRD